MSPSPCIPENTSFAIAGEPYLQSSGLKDVLDDGNKKSLPGDCLQVHVRMRAFSGRKVTPDGEGLPGRIG